MAKEEVNKTQMIREYFEKDPNVKTADIVAALKKRKIVTNSNYVGTVKAKMKAKAAAKKPAKAASAPAKAVPVSDKVSLGDLVKAKKLADDLGGVEKAKEMLNALAKLS